MIVEVFIFIAAFIILAKSSKMVIDSTIVISEYTGLSQLAVGFIIVSVAVSVPDFVVAVTASAADKTPLAIGDVLGSSIANICLVLGIATLMKRVVIERKHLIDSAELLLLICIVPAIMLSKGFVGFYEGIILLIVFGIYCFFMMKDRFQLNIKDGVTRKQWRGAIILFFVGMVLVIISAQFLVMSASEMARYIGISEAIIGMTIVALGTTLPELAVDVTAIRRGQMALAIGDILGSTVINLTLILGAALVISPLSTDSSVYTIPLAFIIMANTFLFYSLVKRGCLGRKEGLVFILMYIAFILLALTSKLAIPGIA